MKRLVVFAAILAALAAMPVWAGHTGDKAQMEAMKAEFGKCLMCKNFVPVFDQLMPVLQGEVVVLDNGMAMVHTVTDPTKVQLLHGVDAKLGETAPACMALSDADAAKQLCSLCQDIRSLSKAGAVVGHGTTKSGDMLVITSADPKVQAQIGSFKVKCATMMASEDASPKSGGQ